MQRLARGCTFESHPFNGVVMAHLSQEISEWDQSDYRHSTGYCCQSGSIAISIQMLV